MITKKLFIWIVLVAVLFAVPISSSATTHNITVSSFQFFPSTLSASVGDTIQWTLISGFHTTTCDGSELTSLPEGAAPWNSPIDEFNPVFRYELTVAGQYDYKCDPHGFLGMTGILNVSEPTISLSITTMFQGFWNGTTMVPDTVKVYLHNPTSPFARVDSARKVLNSSGTATLDFPNAPPSTYYIDVRHRNTLETWSKTAQLFNGLTSYNFTTAANKAYGDNLVLKLGKYTNYSGDVNQDGVIDGSDLALVDNDANFFVSGYVKTDVNGDTVVDGSDGSITENNAANFVSVANPILGTKVNH